LKDAVSASILKRLKRLFAGWRNFAIQTETSWSFTNARNDETRNHGERAFGHFYHSSFEFVSSFVIRHSSLRSCLFSSIRPRASLCTASLEALGHFIHGNAWITGRTLSPVLRQAK